MSGERAKRRESAEHQVIFLFSLLFLALSLAQPH